MRARHALLALAAVAAAALPLLSTTHAAFSDSQASSAALQTGSTFKPVSLSSPGLSGTATLGHTLTLSPGTWGYVHNPSDSVDSTGNQSINQTEQWQWCLLGTCHNISGTTTTTLDINAALVVTVGGSLTGVTFKVVETATNLAGSTAATAGPLP